MLVLKRNNNWFPRVPSTFDENLFNNFFDWNNESVTRSTQPDVNIKENEKDYQIEVAAPGMKKDNFHIEVNKNVLTISASSESKNEEKDEEGKYYCKGFSYDSFNRSFNLGDNLVKEDKIDAKYVDGILRVILPKKEEAKVETSRMIKIS
jgi:HSP20 family protein